MPVLAEIVAAPLLAGIAEGRDWREEGCRENGEAPMKNVFPLAFIFLIFFSWISTSHAQPADTLLVNGKVLVGDDLFLVREAIAVRDGRIVYAAGPYEKLEK